ncbi:MAG: 50S ribosomal protein L30 [Actinobacteria bacterium 69-20]|jgi:large subunit ribosomal protein L30|nr:50S ribosomal protein L30 [Actinomycetota bacterium]OJV28781.1 MAG: 50S ribosomal protein L30 [Actinobacteria bacterium 69-20]
MAQLKVTQVKSLIGANPKARESVRSLGLKRIHHSVLIEDTPQSRGYLHAARHLVAVAEAGAADEAAGTKRSGK